MDIKGLRGIVIWCDGSSDNENRISSAIAKYEDGICKYDHCAISVSKADSTAAELHAIAFAASSTADPSNTVIFSDSKAAISALKRRVKPANVSAEIWQGLCSALDDGIIIEHRKRRSSQEMADVDNLARDAVRSSQNAEHRAFRLNLLAAVKAVYGDNLGQRIRKLLFTAVPKPEMESSIGDILPPAMPHQEENFVVFKTHEGQKRLHSIKGCLEVAALDSIEADGIMADVPTDIPLSVTHQNGRWVFHRNI